MNHREFALDAQAAPQLCAAWSGIRCPIGLERLRRDHTPFSYTGEVFGVGPGASNGRGLRIGGLRYSRGLDRDRDQSDRSAQKRRQFEEARTSCARPPRKALRDTNTGLAGYCGGYSGVYESGVSRDEFTNACSNSRAVRGSDRHAYA